MAGTPKKSSPAKTSPTKKDTIPKTKDSKKSPVKFPVKDSPSSKTSPKKEDSAAKALELYAQGKRHLLVNDVNSAVNSLQEACRMLAAQHGETAPELGDAYFYYGRALLELARIENGVLGNALEGVPEGEDEDLDSSQFENTDKMPEEEKEKVAEQVGEALEENFKKCEKKSSPSKNGDAKDKEVNGDADEPMEDADKKEKSPSKNKDAKKSPAKDEKDTKEKSPTKDKKDESAMETESKKDGESKDESEDESQEEGEDDESQEDEEDTEEGKAEGEKAEEDEDVSNLQLAWEILELAKVIYQKQEEGDKEMSLKAAQVFLKLGEVGLESENYPQCIEDFQSCLKIQEKHMKADDRCIAETHYQLGVAHSFNDDFDQSIESFTKASKIIEERSANLVKMKKEKEGWTKEEKKKDAETLEDPSYTEEAEIKELCNLLPEIKEKITDMEEMKKDSKDKINKVKKELGMASAIGGTKEIESISNGFGSSSTSGDAAPMATSMIRKKRKPEDEAEGDDASKKTKAENGTKNGHSSPEKMDTDKTKKSSTEELKIKAAVDMEKKTKEIKEQAA